MNINCLRNPFDSHNTIVICTLKTLSSFENLCTFDAVLNGFRKLPLTDGFCTRILSLFTFWNDALFSLSVLSVKVARFAIERQWSCCAAWGAIANSLNCLQLVGMWVWRNRDALFTLCTSCRLSCFAIAPLEAQQDLGAQLQNAQLLSAIGSNK